MIWNAALDVGVDAMNHDHQDILDAMNAVYDGSQAGDAGASMMAKITRLGQITTRHFADEEAWMANHGYPDLARHKMIHEKLLSDFRDHAAAIGRAGGVPNDAFFNFLRLWLSAHITCIDVKYGRYAQPKAA